MQRKLLVYKVLILLLFHGLLSAQSVDVDKFEEEISASSYEHPKENNSLFQRLKSIESDSINWPIIEIGGGAGLEYFALLYNLNIAADLYLINRKNYKISISNRSGLIAGIGPGALIYTFPSIKYQQNISNYWLLLGIGREYGKIVSGFDIDNENYQLDYRIDLGLRIYNSANSSVEFYVPIRGGDRFPWYFTGLSVNYYFMF